MSIKKKAISGLIWTFTQQVSVQGINVITGLILARILMPAEFGLIGMLTIFMAVGNSLMDSGMTSSLIRKSDADQKDYSTVFMVNIIFSILLYVILFFCAPLIALFFKQPALTSIMRVYTITFIITAFVGVQTTKLTKEMRFKVQMYMQLPSVILGGIVGIFLAKNGYGVWSLVWMTIVQSFLFALQHWIFAGWVPDLKIDKACLKYHLNFGYKLTFSGLLDTFYSNIYNVIIGRFFNASELGYFTRAQSLQMLPVSNMSRALEKVTYPMFSAIKDEGKLKKAYQMLMHQVIFWIAPLMVLLIIIAKPLFILLLTKKWLPSVPFFQLLCINGILYPFHSYNLNILKVKGRSDLFLRLEIVKKLFITVGIFFAVFWGIYALLILQVITSIFAFVVNTWYSGKFIDYSGWEQLKEIGPTIIIAGIIGAIVTLINTYLFVPMHLSNLITVLILTILYYALFFLYSYFSKMAALNDFRQLILKRA
ncbi:lipopolysaccharide biosynthesis protein [Taibaiella lutea]|uniref:Lipopolysaccharide biosynthesis protein n=1 Tax=Taibaiella lutea TaxID=2608001 RepID=A0A5M6CM95_9BACT|nr:lipopolysaccharide biosynthesis protein [Taibaiella lutea]KAA5536254.1 lipopolysaccharide biosynthesis protein [Taibaiella lutea]